LQRPYLLVFAAWIGLILCGGPALAGSIDLTAVSQGWINSSGVFSDSVSANNYYYIGNCSSYSCEEYAGEYRNYFEFSIPTITGSIASASLVLHSHNVGLNQSSQAVLYQVTAIPSGFGFDDLGEGTLYGSRTYTPDDFWVTRSIELDAAALADILAAQGGTFRLGGRLSSGIAFGPGEEDQYIFGAGYDFQQLVLTTSDAAPVPEPGSLLLLASGAAVLATGVRRRRGAR
jgi:hypothetical protein